MLNELFQQFGLLLETVNRADKLRQQLSRWDPEPQLLEIHYLLTGASIQVTQTPLPLEQRGLLTAAQPQQTLTPEQMLSAMTLAFEPARNVILSVDQVWQELDTQLRQADQMLARLPETATLPQAIAALQLDRDPLGAKVIFETEIAPAIAKLRQVYTQLQQSHPQLPHLMELQRCTIASYQEALEK